MAMDPVQDAVPVIYESEYSCAALSLFINQGTHNPLTLFFSFCACAVAMVTGWRCPLYVSWALNLVLVHLRCVLVLFLCEYGTLLLPGCQLSF